MGMYHYADLQLKYSSSSSLQNDTQVRNLDDSDEEQLEEALFQSGAVRWPEKPRGVLEGSAVVP